MKVCLSHNYILQSQKLRLQSLWKSRSFQLLVLDIAMDDRLLDNYILCLTETQCEAGSDDYWISFEYAIHFNNIDNKSTNSTAYGLSDVIEILANKDFNGICIFNIWKNILVIIPFQWHWYIRVHMHERQLQIM